MTELPGYTRTSFAGLARTYADGVRGLLYPGNGRLPSSQTRELGNGSIADRAAALLPISEQLTSVILVERDWPSSTAFEPSAPRLLAKAVCDLEIGIYLLREATPEHEGGTRGAPYPRMRPSDQAALDGVLAILLQQAPVTASATTRSAALLPADRANAQSQLQLTVQDALHGIMERAVRSGQNALSGIIVLGFGQVAQAAGMLGMDLAKTLGQAERASQWYRLFSDFAVAAYNAVVSLFGPLMLQMATNQAVSWVNEMARGKEFGTLLEGLYQTGQTRRYLTDVIAASQAGVEHFTAAIAGVETLHDGFQQQMALIDKLLLGLQLCSGVPAGALPQVRLFLTALYLAGGAYVVLAGADYVDSEHIKWLRRVVGVRKVVESQLYRG